MDEDKRESGDDKGSSQDPEQVRSQQPSYMIPKRDFMKNMTSNDWLAKAVSLSVLIMFIGVIFLSVAPFITNYGYDTPDEVGQLDDAALR